MVTAMAESSTLSVPDQYELLLSKLSRAEREMDGELREHVRNRADDLERAGLSHAEAERRAMCVDPVTALRYE